MRTVLLISNTELDAPGGRAEKFKTRNHLLKNYGWEMEVAHVPNLASSPRTIIRYTRLARSGEIDVINGVNNPVHLQIVALAISYLSGVPFLAEFRDPLIKNPDFETKSVSGFLMYLLEPLIVYAADQIVWGDGIQISDSYFDETYGEYLQSKWYKLPLLGYVSERFETAEAKDFEPFTITYAGSYYEGWSEPYRFLEGFRIFINRNNLSPDDIQFRSYGDWSGEYTETVIDFGLSNFVQTYDFIPHEEVIPVLKGSDVLLYIGGDDPRNELNLPSKIWDYIGAKKPILGVVDPNFRTGRFIREENVGIVANPSDTENIADKIAECYHGEYALSPDSLGDRFQRTQFIKDLAMVLEKTANGETITGTWD